MPKRQYPHVADITDYPVQQTIRLLWDKIFDHENQLTETNSAVAKTNETLMAQSSQITAATALARNATKPIAAITVTPSTPPGAVPPPPPSDNGGGEQGCSTAGGTGHIDPALPVDPIAAGMIVCGVGNEFPSLLLAVANQGIRDANRAELLNRMIWHLNLQGIPTSHYGAVGSSGYQFILLMQFTNAAGVYQSAYRVTTYDTFSTAMQTVMVFSGTTLGASVTPDGGTAD